MSSKVPLGEVAKFINGRAFKPSDWGSNGLPIIRIQNLTNEDAAFNYYDKAVEEQYYVKDGDLLISWSATLDVFIWNRGDAILNQHIFKAISDTSKISKMFLFYALKYVMDDLRAQTHGATMKHITRKPFEQTKIYLPSLSEQERIVRLLDEAESLRATRERANARMEQFVPALFQEMFGDFKEMTTLGNLVEEFRYGTSNKSNPNGYPTLRIPNVIGQKVDLDDLKYVPVNNEEFKRIQMNEGDILFVRSNGNPDNIGRSAVFESNLISEAGYEPEKFIYASYLIRARLKKEIVDPHYLQVYLSTNDGRKEVKKRARTSAGQYNINTENLSTIHILLPPLALQREFAARVGEARGVQSAQGKSAGRVEALYQSMLSRVFAGEL